MPDINMFRTDVLIAGTGCSGLYMAMNLPSDKKILMITKSDCESSDSFLAQVGMCMLKNEEDYDSYFEDTMKAGHYENDRKSVEIMIRSSAGVEAIAKGTVGAVQLKLPIKNIQAIPIPLLEATEMQKLSEILSIIFNQISANVIEAKRLSEIRDTLLPKLMSGEIDVSSVQL